MKKLVGLAALVLAGCTVTIKTTSDDLIGGPNNVVWPETRQLMVNPGLPHYQIKKSKEQGERELVGLALRSTIEESFAFDEPTSTWYECGILESEASCIIAFQGQGTRIYHIHPAKSSYDRSAEPMGEMLETLDEITKSLDELQNKKSEKTESRQQLDERVRLQKVANKYYSAIPSHADLASAWKTNHLVARSLASQFGITDYAVAPMSEIEWNGVSKEFEHFVETTERRGLKWFLADVEQSNALIGWLSEKDPIEEAFAYINRKFAGKIMLTYRPMKATE